MKRFVLALLVLGLLGASTPNAAAGPPRVRLTTKSVATPGEGADQDTSVKNTSPNGRFAVIVSTADDLITDFVDQNQTACAGVDCPDLYLFDRKTRRMSLINHIVGAPKTSTAVPAYHFEVLVANDGSVIFLSDANDLVSPFTDNSSPPDGNPTCINYTCETFRYKAGKVTLVSGADGNPTVGADGGSAQLGEISANGRVLWMDTLATNIGSTTVINPGVQPQIYVKNLVTRKASLVNAKASAPNETASTITPDDVFMNTTGTKITLTTAADDLTTTLPGPKDPGLQDAYLYDVKTKTMRLISRDPSVPDTAANNASSAGRPSPNGRYVPVNSGADLVDGLDDANTTACFNPTLMTTVDCPDAYRYDAKTQSMSLVGRSHGDPLKTADNAAIGLFAMSNGDVALASLASDHLPTGVTFTDNNLVTNHFFCLNPQFVNPTPGNCLDLFVFRQKTKRTSLVVHAAGAPNTTPNSAIITLDDLLQQPHASLSKLAFAASHQPDEIQIVTVNATGGTFTLTFDGQTTGPIAENAAAADVLAALAALSNVEPLDLAGGGPAGGPWFVQFGGQFAGNDVAEMTANPAGLTGGASTAIVTTGKAGNSPGLVDNFTPSIADGEVYQWSAKGNTIRAISRNVDSPDTGTGFSFLSLQDGFRQSANGSVVYFRSHSSDLVNPFTAEIPFKFNIFDYGP